MKYVQKEQELYIIMDTTVFQQLAIQTESEYPNENGGMLAGRYSNDRKTVYIKQLVTPAAKKTDCTSFVREATGMDAFWNELAKKDCNMWVSGIVIPTDQQSIAKPTMKPWLKLNMR